MGSYVKKGERSQKVGEREMFEMQKLALQTQE